LLIGFGPKFHSPRNRGDRNQNTDLDRPILHRHPKSYQGFPSPLKTVGQFRERGLMRLFYRRPRGRGSTAKARQARPRRQEDSKLAFFRSAKGPIHHRLRETPGHTDDFRADPTFRGSEGDDFAILVEAPCSLTSPAAPGSLPRPTASSFKINFGS
jgi:hypothetical protein